MTNSTFLVELGTEELPPKALRSLASAFAEGVAEGLQRQHLEHGEVRWYASPRRLAVAVSTLAPQAPDLDTEALGPPADKAREEDGSWSKAAQGFARKQGIEPDELSVIETDKGPRLGHRRTEAGAEAAAVLPAIVSDALSNLPVPKRMRWGASRTEFVRPAHWLVMLHGNDVVDAQILGLTADRNTRGHRFHSSGPIELENADVYVDTLLEQGSVMVDFDQRRERIREAVIAAGKDAGGQAVIDDGLLDEVTSLTEWPVALGGRFEERFLAVPAEALISSMKEHQKYFHVVDSEGALLPNFITVANIESTDPDKVIDGNERVIRARLSDAAFFYEKDLKISLNERVEQLRNVVFQQQLGSMHDRAQRLSKLAGEFAPALGCDPELARRAGLLAKADLVSELVLEFGDLQGIAGAYYARHHGEEADVAQAMVDQYRPGHAGDALPQTRVGAALALAERFDTLTGIFGIGQEPTGSKDPFALRRASVGVLRILIEMEVDLDLREAIAHALAGFDVDLKADTVDRVVAYVLDRLRARYQDQGISAEVYLAVQARGISHPLDFERRILAVTAFSQLPEAESLAAANKRVANILEKQVGESVATAVNDALLAEGAERALAAAVAELRSQVAPLLEQGDYGAILTALATLRKPVDTFFDEVMVMVEDEKLRANRLSLLQQLRGLFLEVADISQLVTAK